MELWDAYDSEGRKIDGEVLVRGEKIPAGMHHIVCDALVHHTDGTYLIMQRDTQKFRGGMWEASAGGSAFQGESALECVMRELREETGISEGVFREIGREVNARKHSIHVEFICETDTDKDGIVLQSGETMNYDWVSGGELHDMAAGKTERKLCSVRIFRYADGFH